MAVAEGRVFSGQPGTRLVALDQKTGALVWDTRVAERGGTPGAVIYHDGLVFAGIAGGESGKNHRDMLLSWARSLRDQVTLAVVPFFFKQISDYRSGQPSGDPELDRWKEFPK